ncbi:hypothetical protein QAD02_005653 [Eretmocerus hayati]|uniref:Uncharacterized protein n=1 Tax=Eretmocerus hayati TaxID=131215 RepID=A0ACC2NTD1_9HYME|nr:hypothetical protein QAD02_005653 [Eretmocerus hayati]
MDLMGLVPYKKSDGDRPEPVTTHKCRQPPPEDEVDKAMIGRSAFVRWLTHQRILAKSHYYAQTCLKSKSAINFEISQHLHNFPFMIHPFSPFRNFWDVVMAIFTMITLILTPVISAFFFNADADSLALHTILFIDCIMMLDVVLNFTTGYFDQTTKSVSLDPKVVFAKYLKGAFIFDCMSAMPVELIDRMAHLGSREHVSHWCSSFNFIKIFRVGNLVSYVNRFHKSWHLSFQKVKILEMGIITFVSLHWSTCLVYYVPVFCLSSFHNSYREKWSWIRNKTMMDMESRWEKYAMSLNRATISLVNSSHYLDVKTYEDLAMNFILSVFGRVGFIYQLTQFIQLMTTFHSSDKERLRVLQQLEEYMQYKELPYVTQKRLLVYVNYWHKKNFDRDRQILNQVSEPLREELIFHNYTRFLESVDIFRHLPHAAIVQLVNYIRPKIFLASDTIVKAGAHGEYLYFIASGTVAVYTSLGKEVCHLTDGSYFGEIALVMENEQRVATVIAIETCEIFVVNREAFQLVIEPYPNLLSRLQKIALERLEKTLLLDELYKLEDSHPRYINISNVRGKRRE